MTEELHQNDPRWKDIILGNGEPGDTIGKYGCLLTSLTMVANHFGGNETVASFNEKMKQNNGFMNQWIRPAVISAIYPNIKYQKRVQCENQPAPLAEIDAGLAAGSLIIVMIDRSPRAGIQNHWIVLHEKVGDDDYAIWDPWNSPGAAKTLHGRYGHGTPGEIVQEVIWFGGGTLELPQADEGAGPAKPARKSEVVTPNVDGLKMRRQPKIAVGNIVKQLSRSNKLKILDVADRAKIGQHGQWLHVRDIEGNEGYVAAWYVTPTDDPFLGVVKKDEEEAGKPTPPSKLVVKTTTEGVAFRTQPRTGDDTLIERLPLASELLVTESGAESKIGVHGEWLKVKTLDDEGYVAAWYVVPAGSTSPPTQPAGGKKFRVNWPGGLKIRLQPEPTNETYIGVKVPYQTVVKAIGKPHKYDDRFSFQKVRTPDGQEGWVTYRDRDTVYLVEVK
ncbi:MAG: hypothetical protein B6I34_08460 [Anaerolineaceae bacterium 4572_32.1]|nr:MAG: hypothetical protein B6I34_08460 [Anaerolineaceae bacterium 4572_32.1]